MALGGAWAFGVGVALSVGLLLLAAKSHGRQIRVERERAGFFEVSFGRAAANPPWVEALWRGDRWRFWTVFPLAAVALATLLVTRSGEADAALPFESDAFAPPLWALLLVATLLWAPVASFTFCGLWSYARLLRLRRDPSQGGPKSAAIVAPPASEWWRPALWGSLAYWSATLLLFTVLSTLVFVPR